MCENCQTTPSLLLPAIKSQLIQKCVALTPNVPVEGVDHHLCVVPVCDGDDPLPDKASEVLVEGLPECCALRGQILGLQVLTARVVGQASSQATKSAVVTDTTSMGRSTFKVFIDAVLGAGVDTGGGAGGLATGIEGFSWSKAFFRSAVSRSSRSAEA